MSRKLAIFLAVFLAVGCGNRKAEQFAALPFPDSSVPSMVSDPYEAAEYLAEHFWDVFLDPGRDFPCDTSLVSGVRKEEVEQKFADWISILENVRPEVAWKSVGRLYDKAASCELRDSSSNVFDTFVELVPKYLYDPNSPYRNEDMYHPFVSPLASFPGLDPEMARKYERQARMCSLNRTGTVAADFRFADRHGKIHTLHGIEAPMTLLFFSNPGCEACMNIINVLKEEPVIAAKIASGALAVVNIYIDEDVAAWRSYMPVYPEEWYNGFDPDMVIRNESLYDVRAIPSLYLLDEGKRVILKDAPENKVFYVIANN